MGTSGLQCDPVSTLPTLVDLLRIEILYSVVVTSCDNTHSTLISALVVRRVRVPCGVAWGTWDRPGPFCGYLPCLLGESPRSGVFPGYYQVADNHVNLTLFPGYWGYFRRFTHLCPRTSTQNYVPTSHNLCDIRRGVKVIITWWGRWCECANRDRDIEHKFEEKYYTRT